MSKELLKARDVVICGRNRILDVNATDDLRETLNDELTEKLGFWSKLDFFDIDIRRKMSLLFIDLCTKPGTDIEFNEKCEDMYLPTRCENCPNYAGSKDKGCCNNN